jgi:hypothetical protein
MLRQSPTSASARERVVIRRHEVRFMTPLAAQVMRNELRRSKLLPEPDPPQEIGRKKYPFEALSIGDNFLVSCKPEARVKILNSLTSCRNWQQRKTARAGRGKRFALRQTTDGVRVWRVA